LTLTQTHKHTDTQTIFFHMTLPTVEGIGSECQSCSSHFDHFSQIFIVYACFCY
jgi:hypothetical protein